jgi:multidrug resistance protein, MATE family
LDKNTQIDYRVSINNKQILQICLPIAAAILVPQLNFITNNIFLGHLGEQWLAIAGITGVYYLIFAVVGNGLNNCLQMLISRKAGENNVEQIGSIFWQGIRIALVLAFFGIAFTLFVTPYILKLVLNNPNNVANATSFLNIRIWGLIFLYLYQMRNALLVGTNNTKLLIYGTAAEAIVNVILDYGLIFGKLGLPNLGFNGAAWASVIAEAMGLFVIFIVIHFKGIGRQLNLFANKKFDVLISKEIFIKSLPLIGQYLISIISWEFFYVLIEHKGSEASAISNVMRNVFGFFGCITWAFAATSNTMVSNVIGQGMQDRVIELVYKITKLSFGFAFIVFVLLNFFPTIFLSVFAQSNSFVEHAIPVLRVVSIAMLLMSVSTVWLNAITGTGNTKINLIIEIATISAYCSYVYIVLEKLNKSVVWGWGSEWVYWITMFIPAFWYMHSGKWKKQLVK